MNTKKIGDLGEKLAKEYLEKKKYKILDTNFCFKIPGSPQKGEIDIVAKKNGVISFVEVKTLRQAQGESFFPEDKVTFSKKKKVIKTAEYWLNKNRVPLDSEWQIAIIAITINPNNNKIKIKHFIL